MATIPDPLLWPPALRTEGAVLWEPAFGNEFSPPTLDGTIQVRNGNGGGLWRCTFSRVPLWTREEALKWSQFEVQLAGGLEPVSVPWNICAQYPTPTSGDPADIEIRTVGATAARSTTIVVDLITSGELLPGMHFSKNNATYGQRMYRIAAVADVVGQPTQRSLTIWPPLRASIDDDLALIFDEVRCVMKLATSDAMKNELDLRVSGMPSVSFVEAF